MLNVFVLKSSDYLTIILSGLLCWLTTTKVVTAQIIPDATLPVNSTVNSIDKISIISNGTTKGHNLFHSFEDFSVITNGEALFNNALDIQNIVVRVTGKTVSNIDGSLRTNGIANLFLLNPNGIIFGSNAQLNIYGSFVASTANSIVFADGTEFSATKPQAEPLLTISVPVGLQYGKNAASIINQSQAPAAGAMGLRFSGGTLALIGGHVSLDGFYLHADRVELGGLVDSGTVGVNIDGEGKLTLSFPDDVERANVLLTNKASVNNVIINANRLEILAESISWIRQINVAKTIIVSQSSSIAGIDSSTITAALLLLSNDAMLTAGSIVLQDGKSAFVLENARLNADNQIRIDPENIYLNNSEISSSIDIIAATIILENGSVISGRSITADTISLESSSISSDNITAGTISLENDSIWSSGNITAGTISLENSSISSSDNITAGTISLENDSRISGNGNLVADTVISEASQITIDNVQARTIDLTADSQLNASFVRASDSISLTNSVLENQDKDLAIQSPSLFLSDGSEIRVTRSPFEDIGNINIDVRGEISLSGSGISAFVDLGGVAPDSGDINIQAESLSLSDGSFIRTLIPNPPEDVSDAGNINIDVRDRIALANSMIASSVFGTTSQISIRARSLSLTDGAQIRSDIVSQLSSAGNIEINVEDSASITGANEAGYSSGIFASIDSSEGRGGNITVTAPLLRVWDGAVLNAQTRSGGRGGDIVVNASTFEAINGGQLITTTFGGGRAGNIILNITDRAIIEGQDLIYPNRIARLAEVDASIAPVKLTIPIESGASSLFSNTGAGVSPASGLFANTDADPASIENASATIGNAGDIQLRANFVGLDRGAFLSSETTTGTGGNITVQAQNLQLRNNSGISTTAGRSGAGGNGGNIVIDAQTIVGLENSDIAANAFEGSGGQIEINADGIFGLETISREELQSRLGTDDLAQFENPNQLLDSSDILAISQTNPALSGQIVFNVQDPNPASGLVELPENVIDPSAILNRNPCQQRGDSEFTITGRGGIAPGPRESQGGDAVWADLRPPSLQAHEAQKPVAAAPAPSPSMRIVEATSWVVRPNGEIILVAETSDKAPSHGSWASPTTCSGNR